MRTSGWWTGCSRRRSTASMGAALARRGPLVGKRRLREQRAAFLCLAVSRLCRQELQRRHALRRLRAQQVAGDKVPPSDENLIATGFLAAARFSGNEEDKQKQRNDVLVDIVGATSDACSA